jgi:predicted methyltransferase
MARIRPDLYEKAEEEAIERQNITKKRVSTATVINERLEMGFGLEGEPENE